MTFACGVALVAQFFPLEISFGRPVVGTCCALYFIASSILQLVIFYVDGDIIYTSKPDQSRGGQFLVVRTGLERYQEMYKIVIEVHSGTEPSKVLSSQSGEYSVGQFFSKSGEFYEAGLDNTIQALVDSSSWNKKTD